VLPLSIATREAFLNAMTLDIAMGGSSNTVLHLLAIAHEANVTFTMSDIDKLSRKTPVLCKVAPNSHYHIQDVNRAGGILGILAELAKEDLLNLEVMRADGFTLAEAIQHYTLDKAEGNALWSAAPANRFNLVLGSQNERYAKLDSDRVNGCIRSVENAYALDGGIAILYGNLAMDGCVVKTAGVDESIWHFEGKARVYESQDAACKGILQNEVQAGEIVVITYEGPKGGPGMQEMLYPTSYLKSRHLGKACALITDGRFSGGTSGLSIGHISPEAASGGLIGLVRTGDNILIDIPNRKIELLITEDEIDNRRKKELERGKEAFTPVLRERKVSNSLRAYAKLVSSADKGAIRIVD
ncbi:MAG: dihydroxy-acid dehydratase, partial [Bacteroidales bacterium]